MKKKDVVLGAEYRALVSGKLCRVRLESISHYGGWNARNLDTDRSIRIRSAQRLRPTVVEDGVRKMVKPVEYSKRYRVLLSSCGNPDFQQFSPISAPTSVDVETIMEARTVCQEYIEQWNLGGGNWDNGRVVDNRTGKLVGSFSYNLRFWEGEPGSHGKELAV